jgi:hypothetical protein
LLVLYVMILAIRFLQIAFFYPVLVRIGLKTNWRESTFLAYGGLRGSVGVALGLNLVLYVFQTSNDWENRRIATTLQFMGGGVALLTLSINGTTAGYILQWLGLAKPTVSPDRVKLLFEGKAKDFVSQELTSLLQEPRFEHVNFEVLMEYVPFMVTGSGRMVLPNKEPSVRHQSLAAKVASNARGDTGHGDQYLRVLDATHRASSGRLSVEHETNTILVEMRQIFLELLGEAYKLQLELGELDEKEDNGYMFDVLMQSVALATNDVEHEDSPIEDWKYTQLFRFMERGRATEDGSSLLGDADPPGPSVASGGSFLGSTPPRAGLAWLLSGSAASATSEAHGATDGNVPSRDRAAARQLRLDVLRALAFKEGHELAATRMRLYSDRLRDLGDDTVREVVHPAILQCLEESRRQVEEAEQMLEHEISDRDLEIILSHYCARILIRRLMKFTERKVEDGLLGKIEGRKYLKDLDRRIRKIVKTTKAALVTVRQSTHEDAVEQLGKVMEEGDGASDIEQSDAVDQNETIQGPVDDDDGGQDVIVAVDSKTNAEDPRTSSDSK